MLEHLMTRRLAALAAVPVAVMALVGVAALGTAPPVTADTGGRSLTPGDAPTAIDLTRFSVDNGERRFRMQAQVADLGESGEIVFTYWRGRHRTPPGRSLLIAVHRVAGESRVRFMTCGLEDCARDRCDGVHGSWDPVADLVKVSAPQRCYPRAQPDADPPRWGRFGVYSWLGDDFDNGNRRPLLLARGAHRA